MTSSERADRERARPVFRPPSYAAPPRHHSKAPGRLVLALFTLLLCSAGVTVGGVYWMLHRPEGKSAQKIIVHVGSGDSAATVGDRLEHQRVISSALLFRVDARVRNLGNALKFGDYRLRRNMSIDQMVGALAAAPSATAEVTVPEGLRMEQVASILQQHGLNGTSFLTEARTASLNLGLLKGKPTRATLEGYLFPNTYVVPLHYGGAAFARLMVDTLDKKITPSMRSQAASEGFTLYQTLTLASIIEREARVPRERPIIASVYLNRLRSGTLLNADPTVQFAVGTPKNWWPILTVDDLRVNSPYNTYLRKGLPPGPIASPGLSSIKAVLSPAKTSYLYFVAKGDGTHAFARTLAEQQANVTKYRKP